MDEELDECPPVCPLDKRTPLKEAWDGFMDCPGCGYAVPSEAGEE